MSSTTTSPMIFTTASAKKPEYNTTKLTTVSAQLSNATPTINQQTLPEYKCAFEVSNKQPCNQNNENKFKFNDVFFKKTNNLTNTNSNFNNINKFNNLIGMYY